MTWASGNPGYVLCGVADVKAKEKYGKEPADYQPHIWEFFPTVPVYGEDKGIDDVDVPGNVEMRLNVTDGTTYFVNPDGTRTAYIAGKKNGISTLKTLYHD